MDIRAAVNAVKNDYIDPALEWGDKTLDRIELAMPDPNLAGTVALLELKRVLALPVKVPPKGSPIVIAAINPAAGGGRMDPKTGYTPIINQSLTRQYGEGNYLQKLSTWVGGTAEKIEPLTQALKGIQQEIGRLNGSTPADEIRSAQDAVANLKGQLEHLRSYSKPNYDPVTDAVLAQILADPSKPVILETNSGDGGVEELSRALREKIESYLTEKSQNSRGRTEIQEKLGIEISQKWARLSDETQYKLKETLLHRVHLLLKNGAGTAGDWMVYTGGPDIFEAYHPDDYIPIDVHTVQTEVNLVQWSETIRDRLYRLGNEQPILRPLKWFLAHYTEGRKAQFAEATRIPKKRASMHTGCEAAPGELFVSNEKWAERKFPFTNWRPIKTLKRLSRAGGVGYQGFNMLAMIGLAPTGIYNRTLEVTKGDKVVFSGKCAGVVHPLIPYIAGFAGVPGVNPHALNGGTSRELILPSTSLGWIGALFDNVVDPSGERFKPLRAVGSGIRTVLSYSPIKFYGLDTVAPVFEAVVRGALTRLFGVNLLSADATLLTLDKNLQINSRGGDSIKVRSLDGQGFYYQSDGTGERAGLVEEVTYTRGKEPSLKILAERSSPAAKNVDPEACKDTKYIARQQEKKWGTSDSKLLRRLHGTWVGVKGLLNKTISASPDLWEHRLNPVNSRAGKALTAFMSPPPPPPPVEAPPPPPAPALSPLKKVTQWVFNLIKKTPTPEVVQATPAPVAPAKPLPLEVQGLDAMSAGTSAFAVGAYAYDRFFNDNKWTKNQFDHVIQTAFGTAMDLGGLAAMAAGGSAITFHANLLGMMPVYFVANKSIGLGLDGVDALLEYAGVAKETFSEKDKILARELLSTVATVGFNMLPWGRRYTQFLSNKVGLLGAAQLVKTLTPLANTVFLGKIAYNGIDLAWNGLVPPAEAAA